MLSRKLKRLKIRHFEMYEFFENSFKKCETEEDINYVKEIIFSSCEDAANEKLSKLKPD